MKKIITIIVFLLASVMGFAQSKQMEKIKAANESLRLAMISGSREQLMQVTSADLTYGHSSGKIQNQKEFVDQIASGHSDFVSIDITNEQITLYKNTAIVRHNLSAETNDSGKAGTVKLYVLLVWVKQKGGWQLAARQAVKQN
jgi:ketosteroid isomerase-like protein